jgi:hypothetical protein
MGLVKVFVVLKKLEKMRPKRKEKEGKKLGRFQFLRAVVTSGKSLSSGTAIQRL